MSRAFTLIETLITIALFAVLMLAVTQLYAVYGRIISSQGSTLTVALGASGIIDAVHVAGLQADHVVATHAFPGISLDSGTTTVVFELPAIDASGAVLPNAYDYIGIYASGTDAYRVTDAASGSARASGTKRLTDVLEALLFTYDNISFPSVASLTVSATTSAATHGTTAQTHLQQHIYLRNL